MKFNCGTKSFWLPILLVGGLCVLGLPFLLRRLAREEHPPTALPKETAIRSVDLPHAPPAEPLPPPPSDPILRQWQAAIRQHDAKAVVAAQSVFLAREEEYREPLMKMSKEDREPRIRAFSIAVLGRMKSPPAEAFFVECLGDAHENPRTSAANALETLGGAASLPALDRLVSSDPAEAVKAAAARAAKAVRSR